MSPSAPLTPPAPLSPVKRWLREPLLHFVLIGAGLFALFAWVNRHQTTATPRQIVLTEDDILQMVVAWRAQGLPEPNAEQMQSLLDSKIREEVLYREAVAMGLDQQDTIVKRRMAQKMDFLAEDLSTLREPSREELQAWFKAHPKDFAYPSRITFQHLYFSSDEHGEKTRDAAASALTKLQGRPANAPEAASLGDAFMFQNDYSDRTPDQVGAVFGGKFAKALFELKPGAWSGPIESGFGWHLVFIDSLAAERTPEFEEVEAEVKEQWLANQRAEFKRHAYDTMRAKYEVILPKSVRRENSGQVESKGGGGGK